MSDAKPVCAGRQPIGLDLEPGTYWWCACGRSAKQPWCDGSHKGCGLVPKKLAITEAKKVWLCACKATGKAPLCDGSHAKLPADA
jgi:CDGSH-type Zn-finger protein